MFCHDSCCNQRSLLTGFTCCRDINIEGHHIDYCMNSGQDCGQPVAEAVCQYLGFDGAVADQLASAVADAPARSLTGAALPHLPGLCACSPLGWFMKERVPTRVLFMPLSVKEIQRGAFEDR